jgi:NAD-reducing hydrogenase large subunit
MAQFVQSHALSFFHLSAPDLLLGLDSDPAKRNVAGLLESHPDALRDGIALRKFGQQVIERLGKERIHPSWTVPGGVNTPMDPAAREKTLAELPAAMAILKRTLALWKNTVDSFPNEIESFSNFPTMYCGLVGPDGSLRLYDGNLRFIGPDGAIVADQVKPDDYATYIGEAALTDSYLKAPFYKPLGLADGIYRVGPLARLNVADRCGTPEADAELAEYRQRLGVGAERRIVQSGFHYHYARLIEAMYALERMQELLDDPAILGTKVRAHAGVNNLEGIGVIEAPRGTLIHHYKVNDDGAMTWANLIVATGHNNLAIGRGITQVAKRFVDGNKIQEGALNRVSALVRAYDPCLSCSTHAQGTVPMVMQLVGPDGQLLDELRAE